MKILVAIDDSDLSKRCFEYLLTFVKPSDHVYLLAVAESSIAGYAIPFAGSLTNIAEIDKSVQEHFREVLREYGKQLVLKGLKHTCLLGKGFIGDTICEEAHNHNADLILIGRRKLSAASRAFVGSVSEYTLHNAPCSVFVFKAEQIDEQDSRDKNPTEIVTP